VGSKLLEQWPAASQKVACRPALPEFVAWNRGTYLQDIIPAHILGKMQREPCQVVDALPETHSSYPAKTKTRYQ